MGLLKCLFNTDIGDVHAIVRNSRVENLVWNKNKSQKWTKWSNLYSLIVIRLKALHVSVYQLYTSFKLLYFTCAIIYVLFNEPYDNWLKNKISDSSHMHTRRKSFLTSDCPPIYRVCQRETEQIWSRPQFYKIAHATDGDVFFARSFHG